MSEVRLYSQQIPL